MPSFLSLTNRIKSIGECWMLSVWGFSVLSSLSSWKCRTIPTSDMAQHHLLSALYSRRLCVRPNVSICLHLVTIFFTLRIKSQTRTDLARYLSDSTSTNNFCNIYVRCLFAKCDLLQLRFAMCKVVCSMYSAAHHHVIIVKSNWMCMHILLCLWLRKRLKRKFNLNLRIVQPKSERRKERKWTNAKQINMSTYAQA